MDPQPGTQPRRFTGKERDTETGWDYFGARYYGSRIGRFTSGDPVYTWQENVLNPQLWNRYTYARNNPLRYVDPDGRASILTGDSMRAMAANMEANNAALGKVLINTVRAINSPGHMSAEQARAYYEQPDSPDQAFRMDVADLLLTTGLAATLVRGSPGAAAGDWAPLSNMLRAAGRGKGNLGVGSATAEQAAAMGNAWVGEGAALASEGKTMVSADGLRQYRPPSHKPNLGRVQANLEGRSEAKGAWQSNAHVDIAEKK